jgi:CopA family copper-resistance protein
MNSFTLGRRALLGSVAGLAGSAALGQLFPAWAQTVSKGIAPAMGTLSGDSIALEVGHSSFTTGGRTGHAVTINGTLPAPLIRLKEGQNVRLAVHNTLHEDTSIHWHGLIVPFQMDGVPGVSFPGIKPGQTFNYEFPIVQSGTYWYHSHSGMQEAMGHFGPIIIDPAGEDPVGYDREHVLLLSDWSFTHPHQLMMRLKQSGGYFNRQKQTIAGMLAGKDQSHKERAEWAAMLMDPTDISDVTAAAYRYLVNGHGSSENWTGLFAPGERVRLRIINASAMTNFNFRIPGLAMTVVQVDGQHVQAVETDEIQIAIAETYDVIVRPTEAIAYGIIGEALDRSGLVRATLAPRAGMIGAVPPLRERPLLGMRDMGMDHAMPAVFDLSAPDTSMDHGAMNMRDGSAAPQVKLNPGVATISPMPANRIGDLPTGLENAGHRVLRYTDLKALTPGKDRRAPTRSIDMHLTANMERYMWSIDGERLSERTEPLVFRHMERVRINLINDTMMPHPIHIHGHFFELVNGHEAEQPMKHTVNVLPGGKLAIDMTADALGDWVMHCHMMFHMDMGMFRIIKVRAFEGAGQ